MKTNIKVDISNTYNRYDTLSVAKMACTNETECIGIYEAFCDKDGPFELLKNNFVTSIFGRNCIYKKTDYGKSSYSVQFRLPIPNSNDITDKIIEEFYTCCLLQAWTLHALTSLCTNLDLIWVGP